MFPEVESVEGAVVNTSDVAGDVLLTLEVTSLVVSSGDDVTWDTVCAGVEPVGEGEGVDVTTSVRVVVGVLLVSMLSLW